MNRYEKYSNSELTWSETIPEHWDVKRIARVFDIRKEKNFPIKTKEILSLSAKYGVSLYSDKKEKGGNKPKEDLTSYNLCYPGDILINCMNVVAGSVGISNYFGAVSPVYYPLVNMNEDKNCTRYMEYVFRNYNFQRSLVGLGKGIQMSETDDGRLYTVRMRISWDMLKTQLLPIPPINEQEQIANYLDWKINEIDRLIQVEKKKIKELELFKQKYIDLQIESIDCEMQPLKSIFDFGKGLGITKENLGETGFKCISYGEIHNDFIFSFSSNNPKLKGLEKIGGIVITNFAQLKKGDFVFADTSEDLKGCGNFTFLEDNFQKVYAGYHTVVAKPIIKFKSKYLAYYFQSNKWRKQIRESVKGIKVYSITQQILKSSKVQIPDEEVQTSITDKQDKFIGNINSLRDTLENSTKELMNLKQSLISEVVTGKIDVRNVVIPEYEKVTLLDDEIEEFDEMEGIEDGD